MATNITNITNDNKTQDKKNMFKNITNKMPHFEDEYFKGIICNRNKRESGKKRNFWTNIILVILIISIILLIMCVTLSLYGNNNWWVYLIPSIIGILGCIFGHYYNTKTYIENSKYEIDNEDISNFTKNKEEIKKTMKEISKLQAYIKQIEIRIKAYELVNKAKTHISKKDADNQVANINEKQELNKDLFNKNKLLKNLKSEYNKLININNIYKTLKNADKENLNIINNIYDFDTSLSLLNDIIYLNKDDIEQLTNNQSLLTPDEQKIYKEYLDVIHDINQIKQLKDIKSTNGTNLDEIIDKISKIKFKHQSIKDKQQIILQKYIQEFFNYINEKLLNDNNIEEYITIETKKIRIFNAVNNLQYDSNSQYVSNLQTYISDYFNKINIKLKEKYTEIAIAKINTLYNGINNKNYNLDKYTELREYYEKYKSYLNNEFTTKYNKIQIDLKNNFYDFVIEQLKTVENNEINKKMTEYYNNPILTQEDRNTFQQDINNKLNTTKDNGLIEQITN